MPKPGVKKVMPEPGVKKNEEELKDLSELDKSLKQGDNLSKSGLFSTTETSSEKPQEQIGKTSDKEMKPEKIKPEEMANILIEKDLLSKSEVKERQEWTSSLQPFNEYIGDIYSTWKIKEKEDLKDFKRALNYYNNGSFLKYNLSLMSIPSFDTLDTSKLGNEPYLIKDKEGKYKIWGYKKNKWQLTDMDKLKIDFEWKPGKPVVISPEDKIFNILKEGHWGTPRELQCGVQEFLQAVLITFPKYAAEKEKDYPQLLKNGKIPDDIKETIIMKYWDTVKEAQTWTEGKGVDSPFLHRVMQEVLKQLLKQCGDKIQQPQFKR